MVAVEERLQTCSRVGLYAANGQGSHCGFGALVANHSGNRILLGVPGCFFSLGMGLAGRICGNREQPAVDGGREEVGSKGDQSNVYGDGPEGLREDVQYEGIENYRRKKWVCKSMKQERTDIDMDRGRMMHQCAIGRVVERCSLETK